MRRISIFLYFLIMMTMALNHGNMIAIVLVGLTFLIFYVYAEELDDED
jgi:hypothetical protein